MYNLVMYTSLILGIVIGCLATVIIMSLTLATKKEMPRVDNKE